MIEKIQIKGQHIWIAIEPHVLHLPGGEPQEYFTASYHSIDPATNPAGNLFLDNEKKPCRFNSPVQALEYASERLLENP